MFNKFYLPVIVLFVIWHEMIFGCYRNAFISLTDHVMSGNDILFFIISICWVVVASHSVMK